MVKFHIRIGHLLPALSSVSGGLPQAPQRLPQVLCILTPLGDTGL